MTGKRNADAIETAGAIGGGEISARTLLDDTILRLRGHNGVLNHVTSVYERDGRAQADRIDSGAGDAGALRGVPFGVKDLFDIAGEVTRSGSVIDADNPPAARNAPVVQSLVDAGAIPVASLAMDEYAHGFTTDNPHSGVCRNPHDLGRIAGGSSGGSAAAVASGDLAFSLGSDTNGSVRVPASLCGIFGFKPTRDALSTEGMTPFVASLDHVGIFTRTVRDAALLFEIMARHAGGSIDLAPGTADLRIKRVSSETIAPYSAPAAVRALSVAAVALGARESVELPRLDLAMNASLIVTAVEGANYHLKKLQTRGPDFGPGARAGLTAGALLPAVAYSTAQEYRARYVSDLLRLFEDADILLVPATPTSAPLVGQSLLSTPIADLEVNPYLGIFTIPFSLAGLPAISVPIATDGGLPLGVQVVGRPGSDAEVLRVAAELERSGVVESSGAIL